MDWALAIERNSEALKGIVESLFAMLGLAGAAPVARLPRPFTAPCCACSGPPNPPCAALSSSRRAALW